MPHDVKGNKIEAGDEVVFRALVTAVYQSETACNANFQILDPGKTGEYAPNITCNTRLVEKQIPFEPECSPE